MFGRTMRNWLKTVNFEDADALIQNALTTPKDSYFIEGCLRLYSDRGKTMTKLRADWPKRDLLLGTGSRWTGVFKHYAYALYRAAKGMGNPRARVVDAIPGVSQRERIALYGTGMVNRRKPNQAEAAAARRSELNELQKKVYFVLWVDNYNKRRYLRNVASVNRDACISGTCCAFLQIDQPLAAFHGYPSLRTLVGTVAAVASHLAGMGDEMRAIVTEVLGMAYRFEHLRVPLDIRRYGVLAPEWIPHGLTADNIGSQMGIMAVLRRVEEIRADSRFKQVPLMVDINIWYQILKLMYGASYCDIATCDWMIHTPSSACISGLPHCFLRASRLGKLLS